MAFKYSWEPYNKFFLISIHLDKIKCTLVLININHPNFIRVYFRWLPFLSPPQRNFGVRLQPNGRSERINDFFHSSFYENLLNKLQTMLWIFLVKLKIINKPNVPSATQCPLRNTFSKYWVLSFFEHQILLFSHCLFKWNWLVMVFVNFNTIFSKFCLFLYFTMGDKNDQNILF